MSSSRVQMSLTGRAPPQRLGDAGRLGGHVAAPRGAAAEAAAGEQGVDAHLVRRQAEHLRDRLLVDGRGLRARPDLARRPRLSLTTQSSGSMGACARYGNS